MNEREPIPAAARPFGLALDAWGELELIDADGARHSGVEPVRAFPLSDAEGWISIVASNGRELALVENSRDLPPAVRDLLTAELARREFKPRIERIVTAQTHSEPSEWDVETDRGRVKFVLKSVDDLRRLGPYRAILTDSNGVRYMIEDARRLDAASRRIIEQYM